MMLKKKVVETAAVFTGVLAMTITAITVDSSSVSATPTVAKEDVDVSADSESNVVAGISDVLNTSRIEAVDYVYNTVTIEESEVTYVTATAIDEDSSISTTLLELSEEETEWLNYLMPAIETLNVRAEASIDAEIVGKIYDGDRATIVEVGEEWTKIVSGNVEGYVYNDYCMFGVDALAYCQDNLKKIATTTATINVRTEASTDASVLDTVDEGTALVVSTAAETVDGWVAVKVDDQIGYVSADYVTVDYNVGTANTMEEEEELAKQAAKSKQVSAPKTVYGSGISASEDEITLLAALIECEAGSYEGQLAVAAVVVNRVKSSSYPSSIYDVVYQSGQFSPVTTGLVARRLNAGVSSSALQAAKEALSGTDPTAGCLSFRATYTGHAGYVIGDNVFF